MRPDWRELARTALTRAGFVGSAAAEDRLLALLHADRVQFTDRERLDVAVAKLAGAAPPLFGEEPDNGDDSRDSYGQLVPGTSDIRDAGDAWRALNAAGFNGSATAARPAVRLLAREVDVRHPGPLLDMAVAKLADEAPELFDWPDVNEPDDDDQADDLDAGEIVDEWMATVADSTYDDGPAKVDAQGHRLPPSVVGHHAGSTRTDARLMAQAGVRPRRPAERRERGPLPADATNRVSERLRRQAGI